MEEALITVESILAFQGKPMKKQQKSLVYISVLIVFVLLVSENVITAQTNAHVPFLVPPFYGNARVNSLFDHHYPPPSYP